MYFPFRGKIFCETKSLILTVHVYPFCNTTSVLLIFHYSHVLLNHKLYDIRRYTWFAWAVIIEYASIGYMQITQNASVGVCSNMPFQFLCHVLLYVCDQLSFSSRLSQECGVALCATCSSARLLAEQLAAIAGMQAMHAQCWCTETQSSGKSLRINSQSGLFILACNHNWKQNFKRKEKF